LQHQQLPMHSTADSSRCNFAPPTPEKPNPVRVLSASVKHTAGAAAATPSQSCGDTARPASTRMTSSMPSIHALDKSSATLASPFLADRAHACVLQEQQQEASLPETVPPGATSTDRSSSDTPVATPIEPVRSPCLQATSLNLTPQHCFQRSSPAFHSPSRHIDALDMQEPIMHAGSLCKTPKRFSSSSSGLGVDTRSQLNAARRLHSKRAGTSLMPTVRFAASMCIRVMNRVIHIIMFSGALMVSVVLLLLLASVMLGRSQDQEALKNAAAAAIQGLMHTPHVSIRSMQHVVGVGSAAEVATESMHAAMRSSKHSQSSQRLPGHWQDAQESALEALNSAKGSLPSTIGLLDAHSCSMRWN
jgi:hypothetical protein